MVMHLSGCHPTHAVLMVDAATEASPDATVGDPLLIVARALVALRRVDLRDRVDIREETSQDGALSRYRWTSASP
jgi:hypothetical protein